MSLLPILGSGGGNSAPAPSSSSNDTSTDPTAEETAPAAGSSEPSDTSAPAAPSETADSGTDTTQQPTDQGSEAAKVSLLSAEVPGTAAQSVVEAQLSAPEDVQASEDDARRLAEAAQQRQRFEALLDAISAPADAPQVAAAPAAEQAEVGNVETDGVPV
ncbi:hypothetical protein [Tateyamaria sp. SN3-11]|uniref:hypothetical protein n=1 Tax=Tateyamaria sp. SN3-11 TaxID=3092147 RepID=UPI0039EBD091